MLKVVHICIMLEDIHTTCLPPLERIHTAHHWNVYTQLTYLQCPKYSIWIPGIGHSSHWTPTMKLYIVTDLAGLERRLRGYSDAFIVTNLHLQTWVGVVFLISSCSDASTLRTVVFPALSSPSMRIRSSRLGCFRSLRNNDRRPWWRCCELQAAMHGYTSTLTISLVLYPVVNLRTSCWCAAKRIELLP